MSRPRGLMSRTTVMTTVAAAIVLLVACGSRTTGEQAGSAPVPSTTSAGPTASASAAGPTATPSTSRPATAAALPSSLVGKDIEVIPTSRKVVALTFDAGGNAAGVSKILSTLSAQRVPGTFFLTGAWANLYPASVKQIAAAGYRVGNHTQTHPHLPTMTDAAVSSQLSTARTNIMKAGGTDPQPLFRFPYGDRTAHTIALVNKAGYVAVRWTVDTLGWKGTSGGASTGSVVSRVVNAARPGEIVLMHVGANPDDKTTLDADALPTVISRLKALGYGFVSLGEMLGTSNGGGVILPGCDTLAWKTAPITVAHNPTVPPVPVVTGIRPGRHPECRYDRITFDITGAKPAYEIRYVTSVTADGSGNPVTVPGGGTRFLLITFHPAQGHNDAGTNTIPTRSAALGYQMLKGYAVTGDFEGHVSVALGLAGTAQVRAGELSGRIYVDVAY